MNWSKLPLLPVALLFAAGIISARFVILDIHVLIITWILLLFASLIVYHLLIITRLYDRIILNVILLSAFYCAGFICFSKLCIKLNEHKLPLYSNVDIQGVIVSDPVKSTFRKFRMEVHKYKISGKQWADIDCEIIVYLHPEIPIGPILKEGNEILLKGKITEIEALNNPKAFNYKEFLYFRQITQQCIVTQSTIVVLNQDAYTNILKWSRASREYALSQIRNFTTNGEIRAITESILLGLSSGITDEVYADFSKTGTIHVLAVSGMHVNIFMFVFLWLSHKIKNRSLYVKILKVAFLCALVWFYVFLTGGNPSALRAGLMFSYLIIGNEAERKPSMLNSLGFSALCLLIANPFNLFNLSFQFSFLAVAGIVLIDPYIKDFYAPGQKILQWLWSFLCISLSAQFFVFPLSVFYFNQFPIYFLFAGIIAVPLGTIILYLGNFLILVGSLSVFFKGLFTFLVSFFTKSITFFASLPGASSNYIQLDVNEMLCWFLMLLLLYFFLNKRQLFWLHLLFFCFILNYVKRQIVQWNKMENKEIVIYALSRGYQLDYFYGYQLFSLSSLRLSAKSKSFASAGYRKYKEITHDVDLTSAQKVSGKTFSFFEGSLQTEKFVVWIPDDRKHTHLTTIHKKIDYLLISSECKKLTSNHLCGIDISNLILSVGIDVEKKIYWKQYAKEHGIIIIDLAVQGACHILCNP